MDVPVSASFFRSPRVLRVLALLLILGSSAVRIAYLASPGALDLSPDEAHYWDWSRNLDWSYYSKGPLVACLIRASREATEPLVQSPSMLGVRLPAVVCGCLLLASLYVLTTLVLRRETLALGVVALSLTIPLISAGSTLITIDAPYTCCWGWALVFGYLALERDQLRYWVLAGLMLALGILAKYTMILWVPSFGLFLLCTPRWRAQLWKPGFWAMLLVGTLGGLPILWWNYQHDWVSVKHLQGHAGMQSPVQTIHWLGPLRYVGTQFGLLLGYWFIVWTLAMWLLRPWRKSQDEAGVAYLWWMSAPMFLFFLAFSWKNGGGEPNWPVTAYLSGLVLAAGWLARQLQSPVTWYRLATHFWLILFCGVGTALTVLMHRSALAHPWMLQVTGPATPENPMPLRRLDPTCRLQGWRTLAQEIDRLRTELNEEGVDAVLTGSSWNLPGEIGFYCQGQPVVYCLGPVLGDRHSQYDFWRPNPVSDGADFIGRTFILVGDPTPQVRQAFAKVDRPRQVMHRVGGQVITQWNLTVLRDFRGFVPQAISERGH